MSRTRLSLRIAHGQHAQQAVIDAWLADAPPSRGVLVEAGLHELHAPADTLVERLPAGCVCCVGAVPLRVTLTRLMRRARPAELLLVLATDAHLAQVRRMLASPPLSDVLALGPS